MKTKGTLEQKITHLERSIKKFGSTELKVNALKKLKKDQVKCQK